MSSILLTGGTGKISSRITRLLSSNGNTILVASRSGTTPDITNAVGVKFDWLNPTTYGNAFSHSQITSIFLVAPPIMDCLPPMKAFIDIAVEKGVRRFVLLSASVLDVGDGPMMGQWFMENFSEMQHFQSIKDGDNIVTATGDGKLPFVSADDIAAVAFRVLTDEKPHNTDYLLLGPELLSYDDVANLLTEKLGRKITHVKISENDLAKAMMNFGIPEDYAKMLAELDTAIKNGEEERLNSVILDVTGHPPRKFEDFVEKCVKSGVWAKK